MANIVVAIIWLGVMAYAVFGGADFGSGFWDLAAGGDEAGAEPRKRIDRSIGPVWEANHVWLIFVLVYLWTAFPEAFAAMVTATFVPLVAAAVGIVFRGGAFVFRKSSGTLQQARFFGVLFATSSVVTPFFLGTVAGVVASGRIPVSGTADAWTVWLAPTPLLGGVLAVAACAWLAAVFLAADADRDQQPALADYFGRRALVAGVVIGAVSLAGIGVITADAPTLAEGLATWGAPLVGLSAAGGLVALHLIRTRRLAAARLPAVIAVVAVMVGWGVGQYPWFLVDEIEIADAAASDSTLWALVIAFVVAGALAVPSLLLLFKIVEAGDLSTKEVRTDSSLARLQQLSSMDE